MAKVTRVTTVCDSCGEEVDTSMFRIGGASGNVRNADLCETCQGRPFRDVLGVMAGARARGIGRGRRPAAITAEQLEKLKAERAAEEQAERVARGREAMRVGKAVARGHAAREKAVAPTPRKRAARKQAAPKPE